MEEIHDCWNQKDRCEGCPIDDPGRACSYFAMKYDRIEDAKNTEQPTSEEEE